jgi:hypothetical protein
MALMFYSSRKGYDEQPEREDRQSPIRYPSSFGSASGHLKARGRRSATAHVTEPAARHFSSIGLVVGG